MTTKDSTLIVEVDLQCEKCYKTIQKVLCKLQKTENIRKIDYENTKNTVTISGPFDAAKLSRKLRCKACEVIKDIKIKPQEEKKPEPKKAEEKKPEEKKPEEKKPAEEKKKPEEKKPAEEKKKPDVQEKKPAEEKKGDHDKAKAAASSSTTTVNLQLQFTNMCAICYPWPCSDPSHWGGGYHHPQQLMMPQWPPCGGMMPAPAPVPLPPPVHHPHPPCGAPQKWAPECGGPSFCGGCGRVGGVMAAAAAACRVGRHRLRRSRCAAPGRRCAGGATGARSSRRPSSATKSIRRVHVPSCDFTSGI